MLTIDHIRSMYEHECKCCRHVKKGRTPCPVLQALREDPDCPRLRGIIRDMGAGTAYCPYWQARPTT